MDDTDIFFTQTIVGAPFSVRLGRAIQRPSSSAQGLDMPLNGTERRFSPDWLAWLQLEPVQQRAGHPRRQPTRWQLWLEQHALACALAGLLSTGLSLLFWGWMLWS